MDTGDEMHELNEEHFHTDVRKFLKTFGVTAQRELEKLVRKGIESGTLHGSTTLRARARLEVEGVELDLVIEEDLRLS